jgi:hypothetical protein
MSVPSMKNNSWTSAVTCVVLAVGPVVATAGFPLFGADSSGVAMPRWVPVYPGAKVEVDSHYPNTKSEMQFVLTTPDACKQVVAFYEKRLTLAGLSIVSGGPDQEGCVHVMNSHDALGSRAVNLSGGRRMSFTEFSIEVVQRDEARQVGAADARIPAWVPVYPRWKPQNVSARESGPERFLSFTFTTGDNAQTILSWYQERLRQAGFRADMDVVGTNGALRSNTRDNGHYLKIEVARAGGVNVVSMEIRDRR